MTTTKNEGGSAVQQLFPVPVPPSNKTLVSALTALVGEDRAEAIAKVPAYTSSVGGADGMRGTFEKIVTDGVWRCPNRAAARSWAKAGGKVWVAEWLAGSTYPTNTAVIVRAPTECAMRSVVFALIRWGFQLRAG